MKITKLLSVTLAIVLLLCNMVTFAEEKKPTVIIDSKNIVAAYTGRIALSVKNFEDFVGAFNFEVKFPEIVQIVDVYLGLDKLTSLSDGGSDYNIRNGNVLVLAGTCNYGDENDLDDNTVYYVEFNIAEDTLIGEYPIEFTEDTFIVSDSNDEEIIIPNMVNGVINVTSKPAIKADINEDVNINALDITVLRKWLIGLDYGTVFNKIAADVNEDKAVNIKDLVAIKKYIIGAINKPLPDTGGVVTQVTGGAEVQAAALRTAIDESKDNLVVTGKKYYVSQNGNDSNDGTSPDKAFKTLNKVEGLYGKLQEGDAVFFERGSVFRVSPDYYYSLTLKNGVTYGAYGQGEKPMILGSEKNYADKNLWTLTEKDNIWKLNFSNSDAGIIVLNGGRETGKKQTEIRYLTVNDHFYHDWDNNILYFYCDRGNPGEVFTEIEIGVKKEIFHLPKGAQNIKVDNIGFSYSGIFGIRGSDGSTNITITNCTFSWIGGSLFDDKSNRYGNAIEFTNGCENILVKNCSFEQIFDSGVTFQVGNSPFCKFTVEDCLFEYNGMSGFEWWTQGDDGKQDGVPVDITVIEDITFKNNIVRFTGYGWSKATRSPAHIRNGWKDKWYPNMKNFTIVNNVFDCANGQIIASGWKAEPDGYSVCDNTYYQCAVKMPDDEKYQPFTPLNGKGNFVSNYEELVCAVGDVDKSPQKIEWLAPIK